MEGEQKEPEKKPSWRDAYEPKDFKNDKVLAMISSGTLDKLNELAAKKS